jgi:hypothetical protein
MVISSWKAAAMDREGEFERLRNVRRFGARLRVGALGDVTHQRRTIYTSISYILQ